MVLVMDFEVDRPILNGAEEDKPHLVALAAINGIGPGTQKKLIINLKKSQTDWKEFWEGTETFLDNFHLTKKQIYGIKKFINEQSICSYYETLQVRGIRAVSFADHEYPPLLEELERAPLVLFGMGPVVQQPDRLSVAVVGARGMTPYGREVTEQLVTDLVELGVTIHSGFMYGVDTTAHQAALRSGGQTVGVLGFGFGQMYPASQQAVFDECLTAGMTFYTPFAPDWPAKKGNFPARNQIVAGMSHGVLVTEAAATSGSLITAGVAAELGREVFAVPGPITSPYSDGTMKLINEGATLVNSGSDVLQYLAWPTSKPLRQSTTITSPHTAFSRLDSFDFILLSHLAKHGRSFDDLCQLGACSASQLSVVLSRLEIEGVVVNHGDTWSISK